MTLQTVPDPFVFRTLFEMAPHAYAAIERDDGKFRIIALNDRYLLAAGATRERLMQEPLLGTTPFVHLGKTQAQALTTFLLQGGNTDVDAFEFDVDDGTSWVLTLTVVADPATPSPLLLLSLHSPGVSANPPVDVAASTERIPISAPDAFEYSAPGFAIFDLTGHVIDCNASFANMVGRSREVLRGMDASEFIHPDDRERSRESVERLVSGAVPAFVLEKRYRRPDGSLVFIRNSVSLIRNNARGTREIVTISEDITLARLAEQALIKNEKLATVGRLSASIAHELNNPLESVTNLLYLISHAAKPEEMRSYSLLAEQEMVRVSQIATQTLRFYRQQGAPTPMQLTEVLDGVLALFGGRLRNGAVKVVKHYASDANPVLAESGELRQVFVNLIGNALDAMEDRGELTIHLRPGRSWHHPKIDGVRVTIADNGSGIPRSMLTRIFEPFVSTKENKGTGLGLWISREIVGRYGGSLDVRSRTSGQRKGTAMSVFLPEGAIVTAA